MTPILSLSFLSPKAQFPLESLEVQRNVFGPRSGSGDQLRVYFRFRHVSGTVSRPWGCASRKCPTCPVKSVVGRLGSPILRSVRDCVSLPLKSWFIGTRSAMYSRVGKRYKTCVLSLDLHRDQLPLLTLLWVFYPGRRPSVTTPTN